MHSGAAKRYFTLTQQGIDFNKEIKQVKQEMLVLAEIKSKGIVIRSKERFRRWRKMHTIL